MRHYPDYTMVGRFCSLRNLKSLRLTQTHKNAIKIAKKFNCISRSFEREWNRNLYSQPRRCILRADCAVMQLNSALGNGQAQS
jgi:hypothetical protein